MSVQQRPLVAVIIPARNAGRTLGRAVASVLAQTMTDFELIIVDDGSARPIDQARELPADARITVLRLETRQGAGAARNAGAAASNAPILTFLDADDEWAPDRLASVTRLFSDRPAISAELSSFTVLRGRKRSVARHPDLVVTGEAGADIFFSHAIGLTNSVLAVRRSAFEAVSGFDAALTRHQDRDLLMRLCLRSPVLLASRVDAVKHQQATSFSRHVHGYIAGLEQLVERHPRYRGAAHADLLGYLTLRGPLKGALQGKWVAVVSELRRLRRSTLLDTSLIRLALAYHRGKRLRARTLAVLDDARQGQRARPALPAAVPVVGNGVDSI